MHFSKGTARAVPRSTTSSMQYVPQPGRARLDPAAGRPLAAQALMPEPRRRRAAARPRHRVEPRHRARARAPVRRRRLRRDRDLPRPRRRDRAARGRGAPRPAAPVTVHRLDVAIGGPSRGARRRRSTTPRSTSSSATPPRSAAPARTSPTSTGQAWRDAFEVNALGTHPRRAAPLANVAASQRAQDRVRVEPRRPAARGDARTARTSTGRARPRSTPRRAASRSTSRRRA